MNQILDIGDGQVTEKVPKRGKKRIEEPKKTLPINGIVVFFAISMIILGVCMIGGSVYAREQINTTVEENTKPEITVERNDEYNTIQITVTHIREIEELTYQWNDEEEKKINGNNRKSIIETIELLGGENTLKVSAIGKNGQVQTLEKTFIVANVPTIELQPVANGIKIISKCEEEIDYVQYSWDDGETQKIEVGKKEYEGTINAPMGPHLLKIEIVTVSGTKATEEKTIVGATEPTVKIKSEPGNEKSVFLIDVEDDEKITTLEIIHNGGEKQIIEVNAKTYHKEVVMTEGELNTIIVRATNSRGLTQTKGVKFNNK